MYDAWAHPHFISIEEYERIIRRQSNVSPSSIRVTDWGAETLPSWRESIVVGLKDPSAWIRQPKYWYGHINTCDNPLCMLYFRLKCLNDAYTLEMMHQAFDSGLMRYGIITFNKSS